VGEGRAGEGKGDSDDYDANEWMNANWQAGDSVPVIKAKAAGEQYLFIAYRKKKKAPEKVSGVRLDGKCKNDKTETTLRRESDRDGLAVGQNRKGLCRRNRLDDRRKAMTTERKRSKQTEAEATETETETSRLRDDETERELGESESESGDEEERGKERKTDAAQRRGVKGQWVCVNGWRGGREGCPEKQRKRTPVLKRHGERGCCERVVVS
jgi:hypothetical protein